MPSQYKVVKYESNGVPIQLNIRDVKQYLVSGNPGLITDQEATLFMMTCRSKNLNPFLREAHLIKYSNSQPATIVVGKDYFTRKADAFPQLDGYEAGIIIDHNKNIERREGSFYPKGAAIVGGWAKVYRKDRKIPFTNEVSFDEYVGKTSTGAINRQWSSKPATMIRKVALVQSLREAFPNEFGGLYDADEMSHSGAASADLPTEPVKKPNGGKVEAKAEEIKDKPPEAEKTAPESNPEPPAAEKPQKTPETEPHVQEEPPHPADASEPEKAPAEPAKPPENPTNAYKTPGGNKSTALAAKEQLKFLFDSWKEKVKEYGSSTTQEGATEPISSKLEKLTDKKKEDVFLVVINEPEFDTITKKRYDDLAAKFRNKEFNKTILNRTKAALDQLGL